MPRDEQYRLLWTTISTSRKMRCVSGDRWFRLGCHVVYTFMVAWGDDDGRLRGELLWVLANVVPNEGLSVDEIGLVLYELDRVGLIQWYQVDGEQFIQIIDNEEHQKIRKDRYKSSIYPPFSESATKCQPNGNQTPQIRNPLSTPSSSPTPTPTPTSPSTKSPRRRRATDVPVHPFFEDFWTAYPKRKKRQDAMRAFNAINPDLALVQTMIDKIAKEKLTSEWTEKGGKYIPHPATWLNGKRWEDEETEVHCQGVSEKTRQTLEAGKRWLEKHEGSQTLSSEHGDAQ